MINSWKKDELKGVKTQSLAVIVGTPLLLKRGEVIFSNFPEKREGSDFSHKTGGVDKIG